MTGSVEVADAALLKAFKVNPTSFYANLHTIEFPAGAVRGQFHKVTNGFDFDRALNNFQSPVVNGRSYPARCTTASHSSSRADFA
ncbi:CHRD domain-containing protein [Streptomyces flavidovirens]|uniref:CHRD domain-containing protein n=1 Tax=Streptomyces flavidovirens TaxID=67298 RepID=UPI0034219264